MATTDTPEPGAPGYGIHEHYQHITPVFRALGRSVDLATLGVGDFRHWYLSEWIDPDEHPRLADEGWTHLRRPIDLRDDADAFAERIERTYYSILNYQDPATFAEPRASRYVDQWDGSTDTEWRGGTHPLPKYSDVGALALFADIDLRDEHKERPLPPAKREQFEAVIEGHIEAFAELIGTREHVYALDSVGGAYVLTAPQVSAPIGERYDGNERGRIFEVLADRSRTWLEQRAAEIHDRHGTDSWAKTDAIVSRSRQFKAPLSIHSSIDGVVTPIDTDSVQYEFTSFADMNPGMIDEAVAWADEFTGPVDNADACLSTLIGTLFHDTNPVATTDDPETFEEWVEWVAAREIPGSGSLRERRIGMFRDGVALIREWGVIPVGELAEKIWDDDRTGGYPSSRSWYRIAFRPAADRLEGVTEGRIQRADGRLWCPEALDEFEHDELVTAIARWRVPGHFDETSETTLQRRRERFHEAVALVEERGVTKRSVIIDEICPDPDEYPHESEMNWYRQVIRPGLSELEAQSGTIEITRGQIRYCPPNEPTTTEEWIEHVAQRSVPTRGEREPDRRHRELFHEAVAFLRDRGSTSRSEIIDEICPDDCVGHTSARDWYRKGVYPGLTDLRDQDIVAFESNRILWCGDDDDHKCRPESPSKSG